MTETRNRLKIDGNVAGDEGRRKHPHDEGIHMKNLPELSPAPPHACLSGSLSCSGIVPCQACEAMLREMVLPYAMYAAGINMTDPAHVEAFYNGLLQGWAIFHTALTQDVNLRSMVRVTDISAITKLAEEAIRARQAAVSAAVPKPAGQVIMEGTEASPPAIEADPLDELAAAAGVELGPDLTGKVTSAQLGAMLDAQAAGRAGAIPKPSDSQTKERAARMTREIEPSEIAASRVPPAAPRDNGNGAVLGNVMSIPSLPCEEDG